MNREDKIIAYLAGDMGEQERMAFEQDLLNSSSADKSFTEYSELFSSIKNFEYDNRSNRLSGRFEEMLEKEITNLGQETVSSGDLIPVKWKTWAIAASILLAGIMIGYQISNLNQPVDGKKTVEKEFANLVRSERTSQRIYGLGLLEGSPKLDKQVLATLEEVLYNDPSSNVRLAVVESLGEHIVQPEVKAMLLEALKNIDIPIVRIDIIELFTRNGKKSIIPEFEELLEEETLDRAVRDELHIGLRKLSSNI